MIHEIRIVLADGVKPDAEGVLSKEYINFDPELKIEEIQKIVVDAVHTKLKSLFKAEFDEFVMDIIGEEVE